MQAWTGASATHLQAALRLSNEDFARQMGVATRTVANWHAQPERTPRPEMQQLLDTMLERAPASARARFEATNERDGAPTPPAGLHVAIAIVTRRQHVLLVQRRDSDRLSWQFPAGVVKPEKSAARVAVQETKSETGVDCVVVKQIGTRLHPLTNVYCVYYLCEFLAGEATNNDIVENASVTWAPITDLTRFIPRSNLFPPVLETLGASQ
jgi:8-oxo-dGTP diphosphatase